jgi:hypothetical protein
MVILPAPMNIGETMPVGTLHSRHPETMPGGTLHSRHPETMPGGHRGSEPLQTYNSERSLTSKRAQAHLNFKQPEGHQTSRRVLLRQSETLFSGISQII